MSPRCEGEGGITPLESSAVAESHTGKTAGSPALRVRLGRADKDRAEKEGESGQERQSAFVSSRNERKCSLGAVVRKRKFASEQKAETLGNFLRTLQPLL